MEAHIHIKTCTQMSVPALFVIASNWKQMKYLSTGERVNKSWSIHTMEWHSVIKMNTLMKGAINMDESQNHHAEGNRPRERERAHTIWFHL